MPPQLAFGRIRGRVEPKSQMIELHWRSGRIAGCVGKRRGRKNIGSRSYTRRHDESADVEAADEIADCLAFCVGQHIAHVPGKAEWTGGNLDHEKVEVRV